MAEIYPNNKKHFLTLIPFAKKVLSLCKDNQIDAVIYGSFAHFYLTKDTDMNVNDIDLIIEGKNQIKLAKILKKKGYKFNYFPEWKTCIIRKGKIKVEVDSFISDYKTLKKEELPKETIDIDFYGIKSKIITLNDLEEIYIIGYQRTKDNKRKILAKIKKLEEFLGRKLK